jgi:hypothetical protein
MSQTQYASFLRINRLVGVTVMALVSLLVVGTVVYHMIEPWSWVQSFYFTACTLTTVGYGDLVPTSDLSRMFTAVFALAGVAIAFASLSALGTVYIRRTEQLLDRLREDPRKKT